MKLTLCDLRKASNKTAAEVAAALHVSNRAFLYYEQGKRLIGIKQVLILSKLYDCSAEEIIEAQLSSCQNDR